ncbi:hypothetical protein FA95DRAFT_1609261 [Auriscalpium vulgare]|uniref:Uncharacterized protein n=1 Tax=Auriscalpium vulgare TaxID=40419 RepID=A0ACB8RHC2_9AGAM|nr:hypothetical protein FA95DRAFT_1609261 [Auriscalpium vulgare]
MDQNGAPQTPRPLLFGSTDISTPYIFTTNQNNATEWGRQSPFHSSERRSTTPATPFDERIATPILAPGAVGTLPSVPGGPSLGTSAAINNVQARTTDGNGENRTQRLKAWCDRISKKLQLKSSQYGDLHHWVDIGVDLDLGDLRLRLWQQATTYQLMNKVDDQKVEYDKFTALLEDVNIRLNETFKLSKDQIDVVIRQAKDQVFQPNQANHMQAHLPLEKAVMNDLKKFALDNISDNPARQKVLRANCKRQASNARNQLRNLLKDSVETKPCNLEKATHMIAEKMRLNGAPYDLKVDYQLYVAVLRRFVIDNLDLAGTNENTPSLEELAQEDEPLENVGKKRKQSSTGSVGRVPKGEDFWSKVDKFIAGLMKENGQDRRSSKWKTYLNGIILKDQEEFGVGLGVMLQPLPTAGPAGTSDQGSTFAGGSASVAGSMSVGGLTGVHVTHVAGTGLGTGGVISLDEDNIYDY